MALVPIDRICDTLVEFIEDQRPVYDTIIDRYYEGRRLNLFLGRRATFPASSLPAIEFEPASDTLGWHACRVQSEDQALEIDITTDNSSPEAAVRLESSLVALTIRILSIPPHLLSEIKGTRKNLYDALPSDVRYGHSGQGRMRVATISWKGKTLEFLANRLFSPYEIEPPLNFPLV
jgi:hypothetical protein